MNELAVEQINLAIHLRAEKERIDTELRALKPTRRPIPALGASGLTYGPLLANGLFYARGVDQFTGRTYERCPTCGHRLPE